MKHNEPYSSQAEGSQPAPRLSGDDRVAAVRHLIDFMRAKWSQETTLEASFDGASFGDAPGGRELFEEFLSNCENLSICPVPGCDPSVVASFLHFRKVLRNVREVDMAKPANRKGDIPRALGLTTRSSRGTRVPHRVIYLSVLHAAEDMGLLGQKMSVLTALVAEAAAATGLFEGVDGGLSPKGVHVIYERMLIQERGDKEQDGNPAVLI